MARYQVSKNSLYVKNRFFKATEVALVAYILKLKIVKGKISLDIINDFFIGGHCLESVYATASE